MIWRAAHTFFDSVAIFQCLSETKGPVASVSPFLSYFYSVSSRLSSLVTLDLATEVRKTTVSGTNVLAHECLTTRPTPPLQAHEVWLSVPTGHCLLRRWSRHGQNVTIPKVPRQTSEALRSDLEIPETFVDKKKHLRCILGPHFDREQ